MPRRASAERGYGRRAVGGWEGDGCGQVMGMPDAPRLPPGSGSGSRWRHGAATAATCSMRRSTVRSGEHTPQAHSGLPALPARVQTGLPARESARARALSRAWKRGGGVGCACAARAATPRVAGAHRGRGLRVPRLRGLRRRRPLLRRRAPPRRAPPLVPLGRRGAAAGAAQGVSISVSSSACSTYSAPSAAAAAAAKFAAGAGRCRTFTKLTSASRASIPSNRPALPARRRRDGDGDDRRWRRRARAAGSGGEALAAIARLPVRQRACG
jgi:hypothetical protein